jgi:glycosyltransferase involved in cell wall biosynthesis
MKILIIIDSLGSGGAERSTAVLSDYLFEQNIYFEILCLDKKKVGVQNQLKAKGYPINFIEKGNFIFQAKRISTIIKNGKYDIVHSILFRANLRTRFAKLFGNFFHLESLVNTTYSKERFADVKVNKKALLFYKKLDKISAKWGVNHFHSITETVKNHYVQEIGLDPEKITVIPRGRKPILNNYADKPQNIETLMQLINVGRHEFQKGQIHLVKAVKILKEEGYNFHLTILGRDGTSTPEIKEFIVQNNLRDLVSLEGFKDNVSEYLIQSDLFVFPSLYEGLGGALIEAQAAGLPIACNDIPVLHEVVQENTNGKFFDVHDTSSIVSSIRFFLDNPKNCKEYGRESLRNYEAKFDETINNEKLVNLYRAYIKLP